MTLVLLMAANGPGRPLFFTVCTSFDFSVWQHGEILKFNQLLLLCCLNMLNQYKPTDS